MTSMMMFMLMIMIMIMSMFMIMIMFIIMIAQRGARHGDHEYVHDRPARGAARRL